MGQLHELGIQAVVQSGASQVISCYLPMYMSCRPPPSVPAPPGYCPKGSISSTLPHPEAGGSLAFNIGRIQRARIMDYEKPEALNPQIYHHAGHQSPQPDAEATLHGFEEPVPVPEDKREYRGDSLWYGPPTPGQKPIWSTLHPWSRC